MVPCVLLFQTMSLHTLSNGANVILIQAKDLVKIPVWKNNRIIDYDHVAEIEREVSDVRLLDHGFHIGVLAEEDAKGKLVDQRYIIDGQHRHQVLQKYFEKTLCGQDFPILVFQKKFETEGELIEYFNDVNKSKPIQPWLDENLILNNYVKDLSNVFNATRKIFIRQGNCYRPYLSTDRLREALRAQFSNIVPTAKGSLEFATKAKEWNDTAVKSETFVLGIRGAKKQEFFEKGAKIGFVLAYDDRFSWISEILTSMKN